MKMKSGIFEVVVVACGTRPPEVLCPNQVQVASPWCEDDTCVLGWGIIMHQVMVWARAADTTMVHQ